MAELLPPHFPTAVECIMEPLARINLFFLKFFLSGHFIKVAENATKIGTKEQEEVRAKLSTLFLPGFRFTDRASLNFSDDGKQCFFFLKYISSFYSFALRYKRTENIKRMNVKSHSCLIKIRPSTRKASNYLNYLDYGKTNTWSL